MTQLLRLSQVYRQMPELRTVKHGLANVFLREPRGSLSLNENCDPTVRCFGVARFWVQ